MFVMVWFNSVEMIILCATVIWGWCLVVFVGVCFLLQDWPVLVLVA